MNNHFNEIVPSFDPINPELFSGHRIIDIFSNCFSFQPLSKVANCNVISQVQELDRIAFKSSDSSLTTLIVSDASIKNNVTISIAHIHIRDRLVMKTLHYALNITSTEAKLVVIRCSINQATNHDFIFTVIIIMDSIHMVRKIFNLSSHPYQKHVVFILKKLCSFFLCYLNNCIEFWECSSLSKWHLYKVVNSETKSFRLTSLYSSKLSWDFSRKLECNDLANR